MKLSVIIVNYNVTHFLEQCLYSVFKAVKDIDTEVFVVDNASVDGSCAMVREKFSQVILIENKENVGFSRANNQAIRLSKGEYVLLLNPDTLVQEDTFQKTIDFMDSHTRAGGLGVKMIDGKGNFLPESKRALPTPAVAFYKIFGLSRLFPHSKRFGKYHLSYLDKEQVHEVEILSGAFMLLRRSLLDEIGLLDETFFMYGEDIDLSYRIIKAGFKNYYYPHTTIIHYKGESTKKGSINYVLVFYNAMIIFARKHFSSQNVRIFSQIIHLAVWFRAGLSIIRRVFLSIFYPLFDAILLFTGFYIIKPFWEAYKFEVGHYPETFLKFAVPSYIFIWILAIYSNGAYRIPVKIQRLTRGILIGSAAILIVYALLSEAYRFSRALILMGTAWSLIVLPLFRLIISKLNIAELRLEAKKRKRIVIVGDWFETQRITSILKQTFLKPEIIGFVSVLGDDKELGGEFPLIGKLKQLQEIVKINRVDEIIFCAQNLTSQEIIQNMLKLSDMEVEYKIAPPESISIIGSSSINTAGELYVVNVNSISKDSNRRKKRLFDVFFALMFLFFLPLMLFVVKRGKVLISNCLGVLSGKMSWIGYYPPFEKQTDSHLPSLQVGVLSPSDGFFNQKNNAESVENKALQKRINIMYAKDYKIETDFSILLKNIHKLG